MRILATTLILALAVLALAWILREQRVDPPAPPGAAASGEERAALPVAAELAAPRDPETPPREARAVPPTPGPPAVEASEREGKRIVRGLLLEEPSRTGLPDRALAIHPRFRRAESTTVVTDDGGRFEAELAVGEYVVMHLPRGSPALDEVPFLAEPHTFELVSAETEDEVFELVLVARFPPEVLEVDVVHEDGSSVVGATVRVMVRPVVTNTADPYARTDDHGRARLGLWGADQLEEAWVRAWEDGGGVSEILPIELPFEPYPRRLVLTPGGEVEVVVRTELGAAAPGRSVAVSRDVPFGPSHLGSTDAGGRALFRGLVPGPTRVGVRADDQMFFEARLVEVVTHERQLVELVLEDSTDGVAAAGRVLDESGKPLPGVDLLVRPDEEYVVEVQTDDQGAFRCLVPPCDVLWIGANVAAEGDRFEPAELHVPFGSRDLEFRRVAAARRVRFDLVVADTGTGEEIRQYSARLDRGPGTEVGSIGYAPRRTYELAVHEGSRLRIAARDHITRAVDLTTALAALEGGERLRVELDRGLDHEQVVVDRDTGLPLAGVRFRSPSGEEAVTGADGLTRLKAAAWSFYQIDKEGFETTVWDPEDYVMWDIGPLGLAPEQEK